MWQKCYHRLGEAALFIQQMSDTTQCGIWLKVQMFISISEMIEWNENEASVDHKAQQLSLFVLHRVFLLTSCRRHGGAAWLALTQYLTNSKWQSFTFFSLQLSAKRMFSRKEAGSASRYSAQAQQEAAAMSSFTKPVYSYRWWCVTWCVGTFTLSLRCLHGSMSSCGCSILIFMALKSSRTGSLPVSEIYGFMTENFPYFKVEAFCFLHLSEKPPVIMCEENILLDLFIFIFCSCLSLG